MLKFFRRIRQRLLSENQVTSYLLYAIGEIFLVVLGILIALQINNWNEERKDRLKEQGILKDLEVEFKANMSDLTRVTDQHIVIYSELKKIQELTNMGRYEDPGLDSLMNSTMKWFSFTDRPGASTNLISSGNLNLISNDTLRDLITQWSGIVHDVMDDELFTASFMRESVVPFMIANYPMAIQERQNNKFLESLGIKIDPLFEPVIPDSPFEYRSLLENPQFQSLVATRKIYEMHCILECEIVKAACTNILELIEKELHE